MGDLNSYRSIIEEIGVKTPDGCKTAFVIFKVRDQDGTKALRFGLLLLKSADLPQRFLIVGKKLLLHLVEAIENRMDLRLSLRRDRHIGRPTDRRRPFFYFQNLLDRFDMLPLLANPSLHLSP